MKLIVNLKLKPLESQRDALLATMKEANRACHWISEQAFANKVYSQFYLHKIVYKEARTKFNLSSQVVIRAIAKVADSYKIQTEQQTKFKPMAAIAYDDRIISFKQADVVSIWTTQGRLNIGFVCGEHQRKLLPMRRGEVDLIYRNGEFYLNAVCEVEEPEKLGFTDILGVDFGITQIITDSDGDSVSGADVEEVRQKYSSLRQTLQHKASKQSQSGKRPRKIRRFLKQISKKERNFRRHTNHVIAKQIVKRAKTQNNSLALENLSGIRQRVEKRFRRSQRSKVSGWSFFELRNYIEYKSRLNGVTVFFVDPRNTSRECSKCGHTAKENRRSQSEFVCVVCNFSHNADINAAINIRGRAQVNALKESKNLDCQRSL